MNWNKWHFIIQRKWHRLKKYIKYKKLSTDEQDAVFTQLKVGDVVFCDMPLSDQRLYEIPEGHRKRPYIIVQKTNNTFIGYPASHKMPNIKKRYVFTLYKSLNATSYFHGKEVKTWTNSHYQLNKPSILKRHHIRFHMQRPVPTDLQRMQRQLTLLNNAYNKQLPMLPMAFPLKEGDVVKVEERYYLIYSAYKQDIYVYPVVKKLQQHQEGDTYHRIHILGQKSFVLFCEKMPLNIDNPQRYLFYHVEEDVLEQIEMKQKSLHEKQRQQKKIEKNHVTKLFPGMLMQHRYYPEKVMYLFSTKKNDYGLYLDEPMPPKLKVAAIEQLKLFRKFDMLDDAPFEAIIDKMALRFVNKQYLMDQRKLWKNKWQKPNSHSTMRKYHPTQN